MSVKIIVVDDHKIVRDGLCFLIKSQLGMEVIGQAANGREAIELVRQLTPDIVVMDLSMPEMNGIDATSEIMAEMPECKVIILSMYSDKQFVVGALEAGAKGYLIKDCAFRDLSQAIDAIRHNQTYLSPQVANIVVADYRRHLLTENREHRLTTKEREVLQLLAEGQTSKEVAARINITVKAVEARRRRIMEKLGLTSVAELVKYAIREGITRL